MKVTLRVDDIIDRLCREEHNLKKVGAFAEAAGIRDAVTQILRMADEDSPSIDPTGETE